MTRTTIKTLETRIQQDWKENCATERRLCARINSLSSHLAAQIERLDKAMRIIKTQTTRIQALEEQQLWYLQKIAKGEFKPQATT